ncbi:MAG: hypothetical protein MJE66_07005, partial [Proteobacteria bacterium]|nr:hypothetical protein [Pseudomonadota bacterium]
MTRVRKTSFLDLIEVALCVRVEESANPSFPQPQGHFNVWGAILYDALGLVVSLKFADELAA